MPQTIPPTATRPRRATGTSLAAILLALCCIGAVGLLHVLRTDLDPVGHVMSEYANGPFGLVMTAAFYALGLACLALAWRIRPALSGSRAARFVPWLLAVAGVGLLLSGVFEVERPLVPDTVAEGIHSNASVLAFVVLITAMAVLAVASRSDAEWRTFAPIATGLAVLAVVAAAASPVADGTAYSGAAQRLLGLAVVLWLLLVARRIRVNAFRRPPAPADAGPPSP